MLSIIKHKTRSNLYELEVLSLLAQWRGATVDLSIFHTNFWEEIKRLRPSNHQPVYQNYGLEHYPDRVELHHKNSAGDYDRHVATITIV